jgi:hypothetical protein
MAPSALKATRHAYESAPRAAVHVRPRRSPEILRLSIESQWVSVLIRSTRLRNWTTQMSQQKKSRFPSISSHRLPQLESQMAQAV